MELYDPLLYNSPLTNFGASTSLRLPATSPRSVVALRADPVARHSAIFILESIRGLPLTVINRCTEIANLYINHKFFGEDSFWPIVNQENRHLLRVLPDSSFDELLVGICHEIDENVWSLLTGWMILAKPEKTGFLQRRDGGTSTITWVLLSRVMDLKFGVIHVSQHQQLPHHPSPLPRIALECQNTSWMGNYSQSPLSNLCNITPDVQ
ncbi:hypothetical protein F5Y06DRAFT_299888 [Hypoxylon sp. FL0890]|nr:hypothetical protein F5Y06DRAFT_299888 [Hypoxylon sp. FL0890]